MMMTIEKNGLKEDKGKLRVDLISIDAINGMAEVLTYGASKYKPNSWQNVTDGINRHYAALLRHLLKWKEKIDDNKSPIDKESEFSHMKHVLTNAMFCLYHEKKWKEENL